jgi:Transglutaminase-like superfamily
VLTAQPPLTGRVGLVDRARLTGEIVAAYAPLAPLVRSNDVEAMVARARRGDAPASALPEGDARRVAIRLGRITDRVLTALPTDDRCLIHSLVVLRLLHRRGIPTRLVVGVRDDAGFGAHAWVEHGGLPVLPDAGFHRIVEL